MSENCAPDPTVVEVAVESETVEEVRRVMTNSVRTVSDFILSAANVLLSLERGEQTPLCVDWSRSDDTRGAAELLSEAVTRDRTDSFSLRLTLTDHTDRFQLPVTLDLRVLHIAARDGSGGRKPVKRVDFMQVRTGVVFHSVEAPPAVKAWMGPAVEGLPRARAFTYLGQAKWQWEGKEYLFAQQDRGRRGSSWDVPFPQMDSIEDNAHMLRTFVEALVDATKLGVPENAQQILEAYYDQLPSVPDSIVETSKEPSRLMKALGRNPRSLVFTWAGLSDEWVSRGAVNVLGSLGLSVAPGSAFWLASTGEDDLVAIEWRIE